MAGDNVIGALKRWRPEEITPHRTLRNRALYAVPEQLLVLTRRENVLPATHESIYYSVLSVLPTQTTCCRRQCYWIRYYKHTCSQYLQLQVQPAPFSCGWRLDNAGLTFMIFYKRAKNFNDDRTVPDIAYSQRNPSKETNF